MKKKMMKSILCMMALAVMLASCVTEKNWQQLVQGSLTEPLEKKYLEWGSYDAATYEHPSTDEKLKTFKVWYPAEMTDQPAKRYPVVVFTNGTGFGASKYTYVFRHMASWGFIAVGNEEEWSGTGRGSQLTLDFILKENERQGSLLYHHIDTGCIGVAGHSQGGPGCFNAMTAFENSRYYKCAFAQSPTHLKLAEDALKCTYDLSKVSIPTAIMAMTDTKGILHDADDGKGNRICGLDDMWWMRDQIHLAHPDVPVLVARISDPNKDHGANLRESQPYLLAWMRYWLMNDSEAASVFVGTNAEIKHNKHWQDVELSGSGWK